MLRLPSKGPRLYACLCVSAGLATLAFWLNPPPAANTHGSSQNTPPAGASDTPTDKEFSEPLSALLRSTEAGDAAAMHALETLANNPANAVATGRHLLRKFPDRASELGTILIGALVRRSHHAAALELAQQGPAANRAEWLQLVLSDWARAEPDAGRLIIDQLRENGVGLDTFARVTKNWAASAPDELARYALALPPGDYRFIALSSALEPWLLRDPAAVVACLPQLNEPAERDSALAALAARTDTDFRPTSQAIAWADAIANTELRRDTLTRVIRDWFDRDPTAASRCLLQHPAFNTDQRQSLLVSLTPLPEAL